MQNMISLNDYIAYAKSHGRESAKFLTTFEGKDVYAGTFLDNRPRIIGYPLLMTEIQDQVVALSLQDIKKVLRSLPDEDWFYANGKFYEYPWEYKKQGGWTDDNIQADINKRLETLLQSRRSWNDRYYMDW